MGWDNGGSSVEEGPRGGAHGGGQARRWRHDHVSGERGAELCEPYAQGEPYGVNPMPHGVNSYQPEVQRELVFNLRVIVTRRTCHLCPAFAPFQNEPSSSLNSPLQT